VTEVGSQWKIRSGRLRTSGDVQGAHKSPSHPGTVLRSPLFPVSRHQYPLPHRTAKLEVLNSIHESQNEASKMTIFLMPKWIRVLAWTLKLLTPNEPQSP
jgi:hypothetical protein